MTKERKRFVMRIPDDLHAWITKRAEKNGRSANQEAQQIFKEARKKEEAKK